MIDCVCFDFDGTLVDSLDAAFNAYQVVGPAFGCVPLTREDLKGLRGLHLREVIQALGLPFYRVPRMAQRMRQAMRAELMETPPVAGIAEVLDAFARPGRRLGVLSSNAESSVRDYCARHGLERFDFVVGGASLFGKSGALRRILRRQSLQAGALLYVGDELRDLEAARAVGAAFAAVGWGYTALERLAAAGPDHLAATPAELLALANSLGSAPR